MGATRDRAAFIDASRGGAMLLVLLAHFVWIYFERHQMPTYRFYIGLVTYMSAPTFMLISGILLGFIYQSRPHRFEAFRTKLVDRGLFLLTIGHVLITLAYWNYAGGLAGALRFGQILDAVGIAIITAPWLIVRVKPVPRLYLSALLLAAAWVLLLAWHPSAPVAVFVKDTVVGGGGFWSFNFPIIPWYALYLWGTSVGQAVGSRLKDGDLVGVRTSLVRWGGCAILLGGGLKVAQQVLKRGFGPLAPDTDRLLFLLSSPHERLPATPAFFLVYGGLGLLVMAGILTLDLRGRMTGAMAVLATVGRNSLFIFLLQEWVYVFGLWWLNPPFGWWWPLLFIATAAVNVGVTLWWARHGLNDWLTVGYGRSWGPRPAASPGLAA